MNFLLQVLVPYVVCAGDAQPDHNPCPTEACWTYTVDGCILKDDAACILLTCGAETIDVELSDNVFGNVLTSVIKQKTSPTVTDSASTLQFSASCALGDCGMTNELKNDMFDTLKVFEYLNLLFRLILTLPFKLDLTSSDTSDEPDPPAFRKKRNTLDLGDGMSVNMGSSEINFEVICSYPASLTIDSNTFDVQGVSVAGEQRGVGSLKDGFALSLRILL